jgi:hypothetical protein
MKNTETTETIKTFEDCVVREDGRIDFQVSLERFASFLENLQEQEDSERVSFKSYVEEVFDSSRTLGLPVPLVCSQVAFRMGVSPENYVEVQKRVGEFLRNSPDFEVLKGRGGGVYRKGTTPKEMKEKAEKEAAQKAAAANNN